jgi:hypothetical protein
MDWWPWALICFAVFLIGLTKSGLGAGLGLIVVPMTAIGLGHTPRGSEAALGLLLPLLLFGDCLSVWQYRRVADFSLVRRLVLPTLIGIALGSVILWLIHNQSAQLVGTLMRLEIGLESIFLVALNWWREYRGEQHKLLREPLRSWLTGSFIGVSTTLAHAAGPIFATYLLPLKPPRQVFVGTAACFFFIANAAKIPTYIFAGQFAKAEFSFTVMFFPLVVAGALCGFWLIKKLTDFAFLRFIYYATFAIGVYLVVDSAVALVRMM